MKMLYPEPHTRISAAEVIKHPTFWKIGSILFYFQVSCFLMCTLLMFMVIIFVHYLLYSWVIFQCLKSSMTRKPFFLKCKKTFKWVDLIEEKAPALMKGTFLTLPVEIFDERLLIMHCINNTHNSGNLRCNGCQYQALFDIISFPYMVCHT